MEANLDIQSIHNYYKVLTTVYFSKSKSEALEQIKQDSKEIKNQNLNVREAMKKNCIFIDKDMSTVCTRSRIYCVARNVA